MLQISPAVRAAIIARPETFLSAYNALGGGASSDSLIRTQLGTPFASLSSAGCIATFGSVVAFDVAPQGANTLDPMSATLQQLLNSPALTYTHFCKLNALLALLGSPRLIPPDAGTTATTLHFLVWLADAPFGIGAHAQLVLANVLDGAYLLLDPTYACALRIPFVGAGPEAGMSVAQNAAQMLQTPIASANLAVLDPAGTAAVPQLPVALTNGALGPQYVDLDGLNGSPGWDAHVAGAFANMG